MAKAKQRLRTRNGASTLLPASAVCHFNIICTRTWNIRASSSVNLNKYTQLGCLSLSCFRPLCVLAYFWNTLSLTHTHTQYTSAIEIRHYKCTHDLMVLPLCAKQHLTTCMIYVGGNTHHLGSDEVRSVSWSYIEHSIRHTDSPYIVTTISLSAELCAANGERRTCSMADWWKRYHTHAHFDWSWFNRAFASIRNMSCASCVCLCIIERLYTTYYMYARRPAQRAHSLCPLERTSTRESVSKRSNLRRICVYFTTFFILFFSHLFGFFFAFGYFCEKK